MIASLSMTFLALGSLSAAPGWMRGAPPEELGPAIPGALPAHIAITLRGQDPAGLTQLLADQLDPASATFHRWLSPEDFGARFGAPISIYDRAAAWLSNAGFAVERSPNQIYLAGTGDVASLEHLLDIEARVATEGGRHFRSFAGRPRLPEDLTPWILDIAGLDTRIHLRHHIQGSNGPTFGADDLRNFYDSAGLLASGHGGNGLVTAVIGTQEQGGPPNAQDVQYYYQNVSNASAQYTPDSLPNPNGDYDQQGANQEYELDVQMQSVGAPNAQAIHLVLSPASEVFTTGLNYAASTL
ncbi:MAG: protease pro-enzyme activation domain-containing protein, partial [Deltaproteobacteria bacterium]